MGCAFCSKTRHANKGNIKTESMKFQSTQIQSLTIKQGSPQILKNFYFVQQNKKLSNISESTIMKRRQQEQILLQI